MPDRPALKIPRGRTSSGKIDYACLSFRELSQEAAAWRRRFEEKGIARGDRVLVMVKPGLPLIAGAFGLFSLGAVPVVIDPGMGLKAFLACVERSQPKALLGIPMAQAVSFLFRAPFRSVKSRVLASSSLTARLAEGFAGTASPAADTREDDLAAVLFTSGSTGGPKGALSDHRALVQAPLNYLAQSLVGLELAVMQGMVPPAQQSALMAVPLFHVTALITLLLQSFPIGRKLVMMPKWDAEEAMRLIEAEKITYFIGVPLMSHEIATHPDRSKYDLSTCVYFGAGGAPRPAAHVAIMRQNLPHAFPMLGYGLTETNAVGATNMRENYLAKPTSTGPASAPLSEVAILGSDGQHLPAGQPGEIAIRSVCNMVGYWGNDTATAAALTPDGFFRSGDIGYLDEDGYLFIVDRAKDIVIRGGENIACQEVEAALYAHPGVAEAAVIAQADPRFGEVPVAIWVANDAPHAPSDDELHSFLAQHIAGFKIPAHFYRLDALPRLGTEKIDKQALKARFAAGAQPGMAGEPQ